MGETGCGKTSLIRHLAWLLNVDLTPLNIHAGISADSIVKFIQECADVAEGTQKESVWTFLDEINM